VEGGRKEFWEQGGDGDGACIEEVGKDLEGDEEMGGGGGEGRRSGRMWGSQKGGGSMQEEAAGGWTVRENRGGGDVVGKVEICCVRDGQIFEWVAALPGMDELHLCALPICS
jgi:hypothetical protein